MPYFSIIVPVYNVAPYLREALDSVLTQTFTDWECLCVDDGSTDGSGAILDEYAAKDSRFRVWHKENGGVSSARNLGLDNAQGEYIGFLDPDDILMPERFALAHQILVEKKVDLLRLKLTFWREGEKVDYKPTTEGILYPTQDSVLRWGVPTLLKEGWAPPLFIRKEGVPSSVRFPVGMVTREDNIFSLTFLPYIHTVFECEDNGYLYRMRMDSAWHKTRRTDDAIRFLNEIRKLYSHYKTFHEAFALTFTQDVESWLRDAKFYISLKDRRQYRFAINQILKQGLYFSKQVKIYTRFNIFCFRKFNLIWPTRVVWGLLRLRYRLLRSFLCVSKKES